MQQKTVADFWLLLSTEGFRMQQAGREPALLVKELLQNSLDADPSAIDFTIAHDDAEHVVRVGCCDDGEGVADFDKMRCVFWTSKTDSHLKRGRMGRGFKEMLVVSDRALVESQGRVIEFSLGAHGTPVVATRKGTRRVGTRVDMVMPWSLKDAEDTSSRRCPRCKSWHFCSN
jgi:hypothetical protein